jgi:hypothetical protein
MGDATLEETADTQAVELPAKNAARECCAGSERCCELAHSKPPFVWGTDGTRNHMTGRDQAQVRQATER